MNTKYNINSDLFYICHNITLCHDIHHVTIYRGSTNIFIMYYITKAITIHDIDGKFHMDKLESCNVFKRLFQVMNGRLSFVSGVDTYHDICSITHTYRIPGQRQSKRQF